MALQRGLTWLALTAVVLLSLGTSLSEAHDVPCPCDVDFGSFDRCVCQVHGDPHITMCNQGHITCSSLGYQVYMSTPYLLITGVNTLAGFGVPNPPTWLSEVTIEFRSLTAPYAVTARYRAIFSGMPTIPTSYEFFAGGGIAPSDMVFLTTTPTEAEMTWPFLGIVIRLTPGRGGYSLTVGGACNALNNGIGLLVNGCPRCDQIDIGVDRTRRRRSTAMGADAAYDVCLNHNVSADGIMMKRCIFDVITTGEAESADAIVNAITDGQRVAAMDDELMKKAGSLPACPGFTCRDGTCIAQVLRCNDRRDCPDGSDEIGCLIQINPGRRS